MRSRQLVLGLLSVGMFFPGAAFADDLTLTAGNPTSDGVPTTVNASGSTTSSQARVAVFRVVSQGSACPSTFGAANTSTGATKLGEHPITAAGPFSFDDQNGGTQTAGTTYRLCGYLDTPSGTTVAQTSPYTVPSSGPPPCTPTSASSLSLTLSATFVNLADNNSPTATSSGSNGNASSPDCNTRLELFQEYNSTTCAATAAEEKVKVFVSFADHPQLPAGQFSFTDGFQGIQGDHTDVICAYLTSTTSPGGSRQTLATAKAGIVFFTDSDHDGTVDASDACVDKAGPSKTKGCPDADGDGVVDSRDLCPSKPGRFENGCVSGAMVLLPHRFRLASAARYPFPVGIDSVPTVLCLAAGQPDNTAYCHEPPEGSITYKVDAAMRDKLGLPSTTLGSAKFYDDGFGGNFKKIAAVHLNPGVFKPLKAFAKSHGKNPKFRMTVVVKLTAPVQETLTKSIVLGGSENFLLSSGLDPDIKPEGACTAEC